MTIQQFQLLLKYLPYDKISAALNTKVNADNLHDVCSEIAKRKIHPSYSIHYTDSIFYILNILDEHENLEPEYVPPKKKTRRK